MSRNGSGVMSVVNTLVSGEVIEASDHNENYSDIAAEITNSVATDGQTTMTGPLKAASGTVSSPGITFGADTDSGFYRVGSNQIGASVGGAQIWNMTSAGLDITTGTILFGGVAGVTYANIQDVSATSRLLGRYSSGAGDIEEITLGNGLSISAGALTATLNPAEIPGFLSGLTLSTAGSSSTFAVAAGGANDVSNGGMMALSAAISKTTASWSVGTGNGALDTGAIATSTWYHVFLIKRTDTGVVDVLISTSASSPTMPTNYTLKRRIGSMKTDGSSQWTAFTQTGDKFEWATQVLDVNAVTPVSGAVNVITVTVPTGLRVQAMVHTHLGWVSGAATNLYVFAGGSIIAATPTLSNHVNANASLTAMSGLSITTSTSAQIATVMTFSGSTSYSLMTEGWIDARGK